MSKQGKRVVAVVLAAGESRRMGSPKQLLPWGETTILGETLRYLQESDVDRVLVVTGHEAEAVAAVATAHHAAVIHNPDYADGEMLSSLQTAVRALDPAVDAVLVALADQPMIGAHVVNRLLQAYAESDAALVAPVYNGRRGNPVIIGRPHFAELLALPWGDAPRTLLRRHASEVKLVAVESDAVLQDIDRPAQYRQYRPSGRNAEDG